MRVITRRLTLDWLTDPASERRFGDFAYSMEELVAELGAAFLCADLGVSLEPWPCGNRGWLKAW